MALESGLTLYDKIRDSLRGGGVKKDYGFFDFGTISYGPAPEGTFEQPDYPGLTSSFSPPGMVKEQIPGGIAGEIDYSKGVSPTGFYKDVAMDVQMQALTAPSGVAQSTETRTKTYTDDQAAAMLGVTPVTAEDYEYVDSMMSKLGYTGAYDQSRQGLPAGSIGFTKRTEAGRQAQALASMAAGPLGIFADAMFGDQYVGLGGLQEFESFGLPGILNEKSYRTTYDVAKMEARGVPGYDAYVGRDGQLKAIRPSEGLAKLFGQDYSVVAGSGTIKDAQTEIALSLGIDPDTYDFGTKTGASLEGFVTGFGGFASDGSFVNMTGERSSSMNHGYKGMQYGSALADVYGQDYAVQAMQNQARSVLERGGFFSQSRANYYTGIADQLAAGVREQYTWGTGKDRYTGGYVRSKTGQPVRSKEGFVYSGEKVNDDRSNAGGFRGSGDFGTAANKSEAVEASRSSSAYGFGD